MCNGHAHYQQLTMTHDRQNNLHQLTTSVAVVRGAEDGHNILIMAPVVAFHDQLMRSGHQSQPICVIELL